MTKAKDKPVTTMTDKQVRRAMEREIIRARDEMPTGLLVLIYHHEQWIDYEKLHEQLQEAYATVEEKLAVFENDETARRRELESIQRELERVKQDVLDVMDERDTAIVERNELRAEVKVLRVAGAENSESPYPLIPKE